MEKERRRSVWEQIRAVESRPLQARRIEGAGAALLIASILLLVTLSEDSPSAGRFYLGWFGAWAGLVLSIWPHWRTMADPAGVKVPPRSGERSPVLWWLGVALLLRLFALGFEPALSDDIYRYIWDGRVVLAGEDPYASSPDDEGLASLRDERWERTAHRDVESVYPPLAQAAFAAASLFPQPMLGLRVLWLLIDLGTCWLLIGLAGRWAGSARSSLLYAWNPLVVVEGVGMGHVDVFGVFWLALAMRLGAGAVEGLAMRETEDAGSRSWAAAGVGAALAAGVLVKLVPVVLIPLWGALLRSGRLLASAAIVLVVGSAPVWLGVGVPPGLLRYGVSWEFNGLLFEPLWRLLDVAAVPDRVKGVLAWLQATYGLDPGPIYPYVYPQFLAKLVLGALLAVAVAVAAWLAWSGRRSARRALALSGWALAAATAASATLYPWYLLWLTLFLPVFPRISLLVLSCSMGFAYLPALAETEAFPTAWALVWVPALAAAAVEVWRHRRTR